jgi:hypothetical protein
MLGVGLVFPLPVPGLSVNPSMEFYSNYYAWYDSRALPIDVENRTAIVYGCILDIPATYKFTLGKAHDLSAQLGVAAVMRAGFRASDDVDVTQEDVNSIVAYMWGKGRFFYPSVGINYSYRLTDWVRIGVTGRALIPVFNLWTREDLPFYDNMIYGGGITLTFTDFWTNLKNSKLFKKKEKVERLSPLQEKKPEAEASGTPSPAPGP